MKNIKFLFFGLIMFSAASLIAQDKTTKDNYYGLWTDNNSWVGGTASVTTAIPNPDGNITIHGYIDRGTSPAPAPGTFTALEFAANHDTYSFTVNDTLVVYGDVVFKNDAMDLVLGDGAVLIIFGDLDMNNKIDIASTGTLIVSGTFDKTGSQGSYTGTGDVYAGGYSNDAASTIDGTEDPGTSSKTIDQLSDDGFTALENFVNNGGASGTLPIELKSFDAALSADRVILNWVTAKEENFSHFEVERKVGEGDYEAIGFVQGLGESMSDVAYDFIDYDITYGKLFYRLKAVDLDGSFEYSPVEYVENGLEGKVNVFPNPAASVNNIKINLPQSIKGTISRVSLYDLNGAMVEQKFDVDANEPLAFEKSIKQGMYILKVQHNGSEDNIRVMIQ